MTARSTMASWKDSTVWYRQRRPRQGAIEHSKTSGPLSICLQENWTIAKSAYPLEVRKNLILQQPYHQHLHSSLNSLKYKEHSSCPELRGHLQDSFHRLLMASIKLKIVE